MSKAKVGALIGVAVVTGVLVWQQTRIRALQNENGELRTAQTNALELQAEIDRLKRIEADQRELERLRPLQEEVAQLRGRLNLALAEQSARAAEQNKTPSAEESATAPEVSAGFSNMMRGVMEQQLAARLERMTTRLGLTPEQAEAIREILVKRANHSASVAQNFMTGKMDREKIRQSVRELANPENQIESLLSPEQQAAYKEFKEEEAVNNARLAANAELLQIQNTLGLTQEQQDRAFQVLFEYTRNHLTQPSPPTMQSTDPLARAEEQLAAKLRAMETVLSPEQLDQYRALQETQLRAVQNLTSGAGWNAKRPAP